MNIITVITLQLLLHIFITLLVVPNVLSSNYYARISITDSLVEFNTKNEIIFQKYK